MSDLLSHLREALRDVYAIERELGRGGMATVFLARDLKHGRDVAVKVLHLELAAAVGSDRFRREIEIETRLAHPNILPLYDSGEADGLLFYVMPFVDGESLRMRMTREHQLPIEDAIRITCEVADALDYAHRHGLIHRDIKPENILLEDGHAIVADFGIARIITTGNEQKLTETGVTLGTPLYMSPEQAMAQRDLDGRTDQYSLACVLYEMLAGHPPFTGPTAHALIARHALDPVPSLLTVRETVPEDIEAALVCALAKVPADRFPTMAAFSAALRGTGTFPIARRSTVGRTGIRTVQRPRRRALVSTVIAIAAVIAGGAAWQLWGRQPQIATAGTIGLDPRRVAVLYFEDDSRNDELGYLADGLTESLIEQLDRVRALTVVSKNGVAPFRSGEASVDSIAMALRAGTIVRGAIEDVGDRVRITARLVDGNSGVDYDRVSVDRPKTNVLAMRDELANDVARKLRERLGPEVRLREERTGTTNPEAWSLVQRANKAGKEAAALIRTDSADAGSRRFALADSMLARAEALDARWPVPSITRGSLAIREILSIKDDLRKSQLISRGLEHAERALALDPQSAEAFEVRGTLRYYKRRLGLAPDPVEAADLLRVAEEDLRRATTIDQSRATAWNTLSALLYLNFNRVESNLAARRAYEEDAYLETAPEIIWRLYATSYDLEQFVDASQWCDLGGKRYPIDPRFVSCQLWLMTSNLRPPDVPEAWRLLGELEKLTPKAAWEMRRREMQMVIAVPIARAGLVDSARRVIERSRAGRELDPRGHLTGAEVLVRALIGDKEEALRLLERYLTSHPEHRIGYRRHNTWWYRSLQDDPRFKAIVGSGE